ncbi:sigma-54-dependent Fis family transcriptional regulator [Halalkalibacter krulwichiae]|uniref:Acetoin dehydrogenase operon transcriptional activator AcoR n=1 Tax=Halalkalibacter krulwichiae TaxID=199441 RepID=A0A1X9M9M4_9BACI|nr:sigma-54-dependent Fis family transcriptional regulator [Halalkalibacter krulwichiae]ARK30159.1 Acetoin dehydrogenase operon transcriptional activator AcoR [Halalkalibacter krulwichiae]
MIDTSISIDLWRRFVKDGTLDSSRVNKRILESWHRCKHLNVDPFINRVKEFLLLDDLITQRKRNTLLLEAAKPQLTKMDSSIQELGMIALITDPNGYVLSMSGNKEIMKEARKINFIEGVRWTEAHAGTNAIGTALQAKEAMMINGAEHFAVASHRWSCAASPIFRDDGQVLGIIDFSCPIEKTHPYMLGMAVTAAHAIEREASILQHREEMDLIQQTMDLTDNNQLLLITNIREKVVTASKPIRDKISNWFGKHKEEFLTYNLHIQSVIPIYSKRNGTLIGHATYFTEQKKDTFFIPTNTFTFRGEKGISQSFQQLLQELQRVAPTNANVSIHGETGTGKEVIARTIHENSTRKDGPFIAVNCGAIPKDLMESELFGYEEGAFTGALRSGKKGKFELAHKGTIFLDEIGEITPAMQVALLRVIQERTINPIGSQKEVPIDIRIITATHKDLQTLTTDGLFREDLFYRLHVYPINIPPLRQRKEDIPYLVRYFCVENDWDIQLPTEFFNHLSEYDWPGNIRELYNVLERFKILSESEPINKGNIQIWINQLGLRNSSTEKETHATTPIPKPTLTAREQVQKEMMTEALKKTNGNVGLAAKFLGVPRSTFYKRLKKYQL